ncbi:MAG TPA: hypothetical protein VLK33_18100 [Terriglobales bacterium]|nr:hypothetical protein [Terriglobales bacterium]
MDINPEQERQRLTQRYAEMPLDKLHKIAADWDELTGIAREILEAEIQRRGTSIPDSVKTKPAPPPPVVEIPVPEEPEEDNEEPYVGAEPDNSSGVKLVMVQSFRDLPEALLAKGSLDSAGIESFLADENIVRMDWFWSNLIGGVKLMVSPEDFNEAKAILDQPIPEKFDAPEGEYLQPHCPQCGSLDVSYEELNKSIAYTSAYVHLPLPVHNQGWKCHTCEHQWDAPAEEMPPAN